jgi:hypothetical protein
LSPDGGENGDATGGAAPPAEAAPPPSDTTGQGEGEDGDAHGDGKEGRGERGSGRAEAGEGSEEAARHGAGGRNEAEGEHGDSDVRRTGAPGGVEGGQGARPTDHGTVGAPPPPEGAPTSDDGMAWSPEIALPPPDVLVEPGDVAIGEGADPRGAPAVDGTSAPVTREGGSGPEQIGIKGGLGNFVPPAWLAWAIDTGLDVVQAGLDVVGLIPGYGEPADFANAVISLMRGDTAGALLSFAAIIPFAGWFAAGGKFGLKGLRLTGLIGTAGSAALRYGDETAAGGERLVSAGGRGAAPAPAVSAGGRTRGNGSRQGTGPRQGRGPGRKGKAGRPPQREVFTRYGSKEEADAMREIIRTDPPGRLLPKPTPSGGVSRGAKWISEKGKERDPRDLGQPSHYTHEFIIETVAGARDWLLHHAIDFDTMVGGEGANANKVITKKNEPGSYGIGADLLGDFNQMIRQITIRRR